MTVEKLVASAVEFVRQSQDNCIQKEQALSEDCVGLVLADDPIFGFAGASDRLFGDLAQSPQAGVPLILPEAWLPGARTVVSFFLPYSEQVRRGNRQRMDYPSNEWLHGRIEGQVLVLSLCRYLAEILSQEGHSCVIPATDSRFRTGSFTSNWSERHVAHLCGLGTFSLSKGLISAKGVAGRYGSLITTLELPATKPTYTGLEDFCTLCGVCARNCPVDAIDVKTGKDHRKCSDFVDKTQAENAPYYGCGKCQVGVPCEAGIPRSAMR